MGSNSQTIVDEDNDTPDWIELYNYGSESVNLEGFGLSDNPAPEKFWIFPAYEIKPGQFLIVFASDKNRTETPVFWETVIDRGDEWQYIIPENESTGDWRSIDFDDSGWLTGISSIGYGDDDDSTIVDNAISIFLRKTFTVTNIHQVSEIVLQVDFDDGFVAFINGLEIARSGLSGQPPAYNELATSHESVIHSGGQPETFDITEMQYVLQEGENVLAVQVHNADATSSDMTIIPILSFGSETDRGGDISIYLNEHQKNFHTDFKIASSGETIYLQNGVQEIIDSLIFGDLSTDISYGSFPDGANNEFYFNEPTPGNQNSENAYSSVSGNVEFGLPGGIYAGSTLVPISTNDENGTIFFTTDGSLPTTNSQRYSEPLNLSTSKTIRARVIANDELPGNTITASYLIGVDHSMPIISLTVDPFDFFDETYGMYSLGPDASDEFPYWGANFWQDWERPVYVEMYETDGSLAFASHAGVRIFGAYSRGNAQKSLSLFFRKSYGDGPVKYQIFPEKTLEEYSSIVLRNSGNDWNNSMMRDGLLSTMFHESVDKQAFRPAVVYINGEYWGILNIREKVNEHFLANNHNINSDSIEILEYGGQSVLGSEEHYKNLISFVRNYDLSIEANYEYVQTQMDVMNYIYYVSANVFINNYDWPASNIKFWRETKDSGKWRWITYDKDAGFGPWNGTNYEENRMTYLMNSSTSWPNPSWSTLLFRKLVANTGFRNKFINTYADQLNSTWLTAAIHEEIDEKKALIENEISNHLDRWEGSYSYWKNKINQYYNYATYRPGFAVTHVIEEFNLAGTYNIQLAVSDTAHGRIRINTLIPDNFPWEGVYFDNIPVELEAIPSPGFEFIGWQGINLKNKMDTIRFSDDIQIIAHFGELNDKNKELNTIENFPNPFSELTHIKYSTWRNGKVSISVYDINGRQVELIYQADQEAGKYIIPWQPAGILQGVYFLKLQVGDEISIKKIAIL